MRVFPVGPRRSPERRHDEAAVLGPRSQTRNRGGDGGAKSVGCHGVTRNRRLTPQARAMDQAPSGANARPKRIKQRASTWALWP